MANWQTLIVTRLRSNYDGNSVHKESWVESIQEILPAVIALWFAVATVQVIMNSGVGTAFDMSMLEVLSNLTADVTGAAYPFFSGFIGAFGAFIAGSNTVS